VVEPYPSKKYDNSSVGMMFPFPTVSGKSFKIPVGSSHHQPVTHSIPIDRHDFIQIDDLDGIFDGNLDNDSQ